MGARINFVFKTNMESTYVVLYSHWGETTWRTDLAKAIDAARPRWNDDSYSLRIIIDQLTKDGRDSETGYGIYLAIPADIQYMDYPVIVDVQAGTIEDETGEYSWEGFIGLNKVPA